MIKKKKRAKLKIQLGKHSHGLDILQPRVIVTRKTSRQRNWVTELRPSQTAFGVESVSAVMVARVHATLFVNSQSDARRRRREAEGRGGGGGRHPTASDPPTGVYE